MQFKPFQLAPWDAADAKGGNALILNSQKSDSLDVLIGFHYNMTAFKGTTAQHHGCLPNAKL